MAGKPDSFTQRLAEYARFRREHGRDPSTRAVDPVEKRLGRWLHNQRDSLRRRGYIATERTDLLDEVNPYWAEPLMSAFLWRVSDYRQFRSDHGRDPSKLGADRHEKSLSSWIITQRTLVKRGALAPERAAALDDANPHWRTPDRTKRPHGA